MHLKKDSYITENRNDNLEWIVTNCKEALYYLKAVHNVKKYCEAFVISGAISSAFPRVCQWYTPGGRATSCSYPTSLQTGTSYA